MNSNGGMEDIKYVLRTATEARTCWGADGAGGGGGGGGGGGVDKIINILDS